MKAVRIAVIATLALAAFAPFPLQAARQADKDAKEVADAVAAFKGSDKMLPKWFDTSYGYVVFPNIAKGAVGVGAANGDGRLFEKGVYVGDARVTQVTVGAQLGGQSFSEVIFFENKEAVDRFKENRFEMTAGLSAVAAAEGASKDAKYSQGVAVFTLAKKGLMAEASVGGQKFKYHAEEVARVAKADREGWQGWDAYAPFYDWENQRTIGRKDVPFWQQFAAERPGRVLELGCGTGRLSLPLARSAIELVGVDRSAAMLARARTRSRRARLQGRLQLVRADIRSLPFPARSFRVVIAPYGILQSLLNDQDLVAVLTSVARVLKPKGVFGIDVVADLPRWPEYTNRRQLSGSQSRDVHLTLVESVRQQRSEGVTVFEQRYTRRGRRGAAEHRFELRFRTPSVRRLTELLKQAGLSVASIFGDYSGGAWHQDADTTLIVARRA